MRRSISVLRRIRITATDGELGRVHDLYFDDSDWTVRYLVVDTGGWLPDRWGLVSRQSLLRWDADPSILRIPLTKTQFKDDVDMHTQPGALDPAIISHARERREGRLRAATTVVGYAVETEDGEIGHVEDFLVDDKAWIIRYLRVETKDRWDGKSVLVAPKWLTELTQEESKRFFCIVTAVEDSAGNGRPAIPTPEHGHPHCFDSVVEAPPIDPAGWAAGQPAGIRRRSCTFVRHVRVEMLVREAGRPWWACKSYAAVTRRPCDEQPRSQEVGRFEGVYGKLLPLLRGTWVARLNWLPI